MDVFEEDAYTYTHRHMHTRGHTLIINLSYWPLELKVRAYQNL